MYPFIFLYQRYIIYQSSKKYHENFCLERKIFSRKLESEEDAKRIEQIKAGPKKSHEWSIFKGQSNKVNSGAGKKGDDSSDSDSGGFTT